MYSLAFLYYVLSAINVKSWSEKEVAYLRGIYACSAAVSLVAGSATGTLYFLHHLFHLIICFWSLLNNLSYFFMISHSIVRHPGIWRLWMLGCPWSVFTQCTMVRMVDNGSITCVHGNCCGRQT